MVGSSLDRVAELRDVVVSSDNLPALLRTLVHVVFSSHGATRSFLAALRQDSTVEVLDTYGYSDVAALAKSVSSVWNSSASSDALLSGKITCYPSWASYVAKFPHNAGASYANHSFIAIPLWVKNTPTAVIGLGLTSPLDPETVRDLERTAATLRLVLELNLSPPQWNLQPDADTWDKHPHQSNPRHPRSPATLDDTSSNDFSERELQVLHGMSEGLTNRQISSHLHLSLSSVGKISMRIFQKLGAQNRREASQLARTLSLFDTHKNGGPLGPQSVTDPSAEASPQLPA